MSFKTPLLFLIFNRPEETRVVFESIREYAPTELYIAADGPRLDRETDIENCKKVRAIFDTIDWPCKVHTLFREENLGCKIAVSTGITWFFDHVEQGIILEDDILPDPSFFKYCEELLELYKHDEGVMHISGFNVLGKWKEDRQSYHGSYFGTIWGWASWKRAWKNYDVDIKFWGDDILKERILRTYFPENMREARRSLYDDFYNGLINTWDYQWTLSRLATEGISIIPSVNLIKNIGFGGSGTHTGVKPEWVKDEIYEMKFPLSGVKKVDKVFDRLHNVIASKGKSYKNFNFIGLINLLKFKAALFIKKRLLRNNNTVNEKELIKASSSRLPLEVEIIGGGQPQLTIGEGTYCNGLKIYCWDSRIKIDIGRYCSIADKVTIIAGGEHEKEHVSNYPFINVFEREDLYDKLKVRFKGNIIVGNDVWIATDATILSGVKIGDGAVVGACAVVVKDVEPYSIVGGNPAKLIKMRFDKETIEKLLELKWWNWTEEKISENLKYFDDIQLFLKQNVTQGS